MVYGVKVIHTYCVGEKQQNFYEELILKVNAGSFDEAYEKAENYMNEQACEYINTKGETVKTSNIEAVDCFLICDSEDDVQEVYSSFSINRTSLSEEEYYNAIALTCDEEELYPLRNKEFN